MAQTRINAKADATTRTAAAAKENLAWKEIRTEHLVQDEWIDFSRKDYVVIVACDEDGKYLCVRQFTLWQGCWLGGAEVHRPGCICIRRIPQGAKPTACSAAHSVGLR